MKVKYDAPGSEVEKLFVLARKSFYITDPPKHEKEAIYEVNERNSNVCRIAGAAKLRSNSWGHHKQRRARRDRACTKKLLYFRPAQT